MIKRFAPIKTAIPHGTMPVTEGVRFGSRLVVNATMLNISPAPENGMFSQLREPRQGMNATINPRIERIPQTKLIICIYVSVAQTIVLPASLCDGSADIALRRHLKYELLRCSVPRAIFSHQFVLCAF